MDKFRKIAERLWYNKERMVLAIMVGVLCWNVYKVAYPPPEKEETKHLLPKGAIDADWARANTPASPLPRVSQQWDTVYTPSPFWYYSGQSELTNKRQGPQSAGITLLRIKQVVDKWRAQLRTTRTAWYDEGESFESFQLLKINPDEGTCEVRSEQLGKVIVLRLP